MNKKILPKLVIVSILVGGVNFVPATINFNENNLQVVSIAYAEVKTITANGSAGMSFGDNDENILNMAKNAARMNAVQAAKEQAGIYIKGYIHTINGILTDDYIFAYASNNIKIISESYEKGYYNESYLNGNLTGNVGFRYIATVTVEVDTNDLQNYIRRDEKEKSTLTEQAKSSKKNIAEINKNIEDLNKTAQNKTSEEIQSEVQKIDNQILAQQKLDEGNKFYKQEDYGGYKNAVEKYTEAIKLNPNFAVAYYNRGIAYGKLQEYDEAISDYTQAIKLNPNYADAYINRGNIYEHFINRQQALSDFNKAIKINPNDSVAYLNRGYVYFVLNNYSQAISDFTKAIKLNPNYAYAYNNRGVVYAKLKNYRQAILDYTQAIKLNPNYVSAYNNRGNAYSELGYDDQAVDDWNKASEIRRAKMRNKY